MGFVSVDSTEVGEKMRILANILVFCSVSAEVNVKDFSDSQLLPRLRQVLYGG